MDLATDDEYRTFMLHIRCENCMREAVMGMAVPKRSGMPTDVDELKSSAMLNNTPFQCIMCDSVIGEIFNISQGIDAK